MDKNQIGALALALIGLCLLAPGLFDLARTAMRHLSLEPGTAVVVDMEVRKPVRTGGVELKTPVFRYTAKDGTERLARSARGYNSPPFREGDAVPIRYDRDNPDVAVIDTFFEVWGLGALLSAFGAAFLLGGLLAYSRLR